MLKGRRRALLLLSALLVAALVVTAAQAQTAGPSEPGDVPFEDRSVVISLLAEIDRELGRGLPAQTAPGPRGRAEVMVELRGLRRETAMLRELSRAQQELLEWNPQRLAAGWPAVALSPEVCAGAELAWLCGLLPATFGAAQTNPGGAGR